jgi:hypothetical protein
MGNGREGGGHLRNPRCVESTPCIHIGLALPKLLPQLRPPPAPLSAPTPPGGPPWPGPRRTGSGKQCTVGTWVGATVGGEGGGGARVPRAEGAAESSAAHKDAADSPQAQPLCTPRRAPAPRAIPWRRGGSCAGAGGRVGGLVRVRVGAWGVLCGCGWAHTPRSSASRASSAARSRAASPRAARRPSCSASAPARRARRERAARAHAPACSAEGPRLGVPPPPIRTNRTRRVLHPVLIGHAASLTPY